MATKREKLLENIGITEKSLKGEGLEAVEKALINVGIDGFYTRFEFKKGDIDENFYCYITLELSNDEEIKDLKMKNEIFLILAVEEYEKNLFPYFENILKGGQLALDESDGDFLRKMDKINLSYWDEYNKIGQYQFTGKLAGMTDKKKTKLKFEVDFEDLQKFQDLDDKGFLWKMAIVIQ